jgi:hypothetical protein
MADEQATKTLLTGSWFDEDSYWVYGLYMVAIWFLYPPYMLFLFFTGKSHRVLPMICWNVYNLSVPFVPTFTSRKPQAYFTRASLLTQFLKQIVR